MSLGPVFLSPKSPSNTPASPCAAAWVNGGLPTKGRGDIHMLQMLRGGYDQPPLHQRPTRLATMLLLQEDDLTVGNREDTRM